MDLSLDEASRAARELARAVLARSRGLASAREAEPLGHDPALWAQLCEAGLPGLAVPEEFDGGGAGLHAPVIAAIELGRVLAPVPFAEHVAAARLLATVAPEHPDLPAVVSGELIATLAPRARSGRAVAVPGTIAKLFASTAYQRASRELQDVVGLGGILRESVGEGPGHRPPTVRSNVPPGTPASSPSRAGPPRSPATSSPNSASACRRPAEAPAPRADPGHSPGWDIPHGTGPALLMRQPSAVLRHTRNI
ncbi:hypothetical protein FAIPA1_30279 [Frankia sp. AiPs1]|uniref:acyl-CoA dehydrogenase family protein n=1 Tax=Frankia sp. AiPa1 TaxID=573492 RepID=UPI00202B9E7A|nr:acyl-CoA dehydrogenase family protein [Frankia sp. AiPa1]MCL9759985.1 acyl-CoA dehydrogenase family protein [Frankia sp. AiPa1]